jgi:hypothetical protein
VVSFCLLFFGVGGVGWLGWVGSEVWLGWVLLAVELCSCVGLCSCVVVV